MRSSAAAPFVGTLQAFWLWAGLAQGQLFTWRREARKALTTIEPPFAPVVINRALGGGEASPEAPTPAKPWRRRH
jgi:hypothetical protein